MCPGCWFRGMAAACLGAQLLRLSAGGWSLAPWGAGRVHHLYCMALGLPAHKVLYCSELDTVAHRHMALITCPRRVSCTPKLPNDSARVTGSSSRQLVLMVTFKGLLAGLAKCPLALRLPGSGCLPFPCLLLRLTLRAWLATRMSVRAG